MSFLFLCCQEQQQRQVVVQQGRPPSSGGPPTQMPPPQAQGFERHQQQHQQHPPELNRLRRKQTNDELASLTSKNYRLAKELVRPFFFMYFRQGFMDIKILWHSYFLCNSAVAFCFLVALQIK